MIYDSIILDIDGTIWNTTPIVAEAWNNAIDKTGAAVQKVTAEILQKEFGKTMDVIAMDLWPELSGTLRQKLLDACCIDEQIAVEKNNSDITYNSVVETVKELSKKIDFYVVSNCHDGYIELMLRKTGLECCVKDFACFGKNGLPKWDNIKLVIDRNNLKSPVYIGDTQGDYEACEKAGIPFIWAAYGFGTPENYVAKLAEFKDLKDLLN